MPRNNGLTTRKNSKFVTVNMLVDMFYTSRFNRDNMHDLAEGEDINNSRKHRLYNKKDIKELLSHFCEFFQDALISENLGKVYVSEDLTLVRDATMPRVKYANSFDENYNPDICKAGEWYVTTGRYNWKLYVDGETFKQLRQLWRKDPVLMEKREELRPIVEEKNAKLKAEGKNKNAESKDKD